MPLTPQLSGQTDLYAALRAVAKVRPELTLADVLADLCSGDALAQATAARLASVDQGLLRAVMRRGRGQPATVA